MLSDKNPNKIDSLIELNNSKFASGHENKSIIIWNYKTKKNELKICDLFQGCTYLHFYKNILITTGDFRKIYMINLSYKNNKIKSITNIKLRYDIQCTNLIINSNTNHLYAGLKNGYIPKISLSSLKIITRLIGHTRSVYNLILSKNERYLFSSSADETIRIWNLFINTCIQVLNTQLKFIDSISLKNENLFISYSYNLSIKIFTFDDNIMPFQKKLLKNKCYCNIVAIFF